MGSKLEKHLVEGTGSREDSGCHNDEDNGHDVTHQQALKKEETT